MVKPKNKTFIRITILCLCLITIIGIVCPAISFADGDRTAVTYATGSEDFETTQGRVNIRMNWTAVKYNDDTVDLTVRFYSKKKDWGLTFDGILGDSSYVCAYQGDNRPSRASDINTSADDASGQRYCYFENDVTVYSGDGWREFSYDSNEGQAHYNTLSNIDLSKGSVIKVGINGYVYSTYITKETYVETTGSYPVKMEKNVTKYVYAYMSNKVLKIDLANATFQPVGTMVDTGYNKFGYDGVFTFLQQLLFASTLVVFLPHIPSRLHIKIARSRPILGIFPFPQIFPKNVPTFGKIPKLLIVFGDLKNPNVPKKRKSA